MVTEVKPQIVRSAELSPCGTYRYALVRAWDDARPRVAWLMLNPSTADALQDEMLNL